MEVESEHGVKGEAQKSKEEQLEGPHGDGSLYDVKFFCFIHAKKYITYDRKDKTLLKGKLPFHVS